jgi:hypothetical protein
MSTPDGAVLFRDVPMAAGPDDAAGKIEDGVEVDPAGSATVQ